MRIQIQSEHKERKLTRKLLLLRQPVDSHTTYQYQFKINISFILLGISKTNTIIAHIEFSVIFSNENIAQYP